MWYPTEKYILPVAVTADAEYTSVDVGLTQVIPELVTEALINPPVLITVAAEVKGKLLLNKPTAVHAIDVAPVSFPVTVTKRPTRVYVPEEVNAPTTVSPEP